MKKAKIPPTTTQIPTSAPTQNPSAFDSIKDALARSLSLECKFTDDAGRVTASFIKNGAIRSDITSSKASESGSVIIKDKKMYFWNKTSAITMEIPDVTVTPGATGNQAQDTLNSLEKYKQYCRAANVSDAIFTPPADVKFQDLSSMLKRVPSGKAVTSADQKKIEEAIKQYTTPTQ